MTSPAPGLNVDTMVAGDDSLERRKPVGVDGRRQTVSCNADPRPAGGTMERRHTICGVDWRTSLSRNNHDKERRGGGAGGGGAGGGGAGGGGGGEHLGHLTAMYNSHVVCIRWYTLEGHQPLKVIDPCSTLMENSS